MERKKETKVVDGVEFYRYEGDTLWVSDEVEDEQ